LDLAKNTTSLIVSTILKYGLTLGLSRIVVSFLFFLNNSHITEIKMISYFHIALAIVIVFWALLNFKKSNGRQLSFKDALLLGFGFSILSGVLTLSYALIQSNYLDPDYFVTTQIQNGNLKPGSVPIKFFILIILNPLIGIVSTLILNTFQPKRTRGR